MENLKRFTFEEYVDYWKAQSIEHIKWKLNICEKRINQKSTLPVQYKEKVVILKKALRLKEEKS